jgi:transcriptional regulator with XRE-family HTH domain
LRWARLTAGLSQRELAEKAGIPQSTIGRIETGKIDPRTSTLSRLIRACGYDLEVEPLLGVGVDRSQIQERLALSPWQRVEHTTEEIEDLDQFLSAARMTLTRDAPIQRPG